MHALRGNCHCGNVEFTLFTDKSAGELVPRQVFLHDVQEAWCELYLRSGR